MPALKAAAGITATTASCAARLTEESLKKVAELRSIKAAIVGSLKSAAGVLAGRDLARVPVLVVQFAFFGIVEHGISFAYLLKFFGGGVIARVFVGVILLSQFAVSTLDIGIGRTVSAQAADLKPPLSWGRLFFFSTSGGECGI